MASEFPFALTHHARQVVGERKIELEWESRALNSPSSRVHDKKEPDVWHRFIAIPEYGGRILHVVYNAETTPWRVITAFFDRGWKGPT